MKSINVYFDDKDYVELETAKNLLDLSWHDFILYLLKGGEVKNVRKEEERRA